MRTTYFLQPTTYLFSHHLHYHLINRQRNILGHELMPVQESKRFALSNLFVDRQFAFVKVEGLCSEWRLDRFQGMCVVIDGHNLVFRVESAHLEEVGGIDMIADGNVESHFFHEFAFKAVACAFAKLESAAGKLGIIFTADELITYQYLAIFINE